MASNKQETHGEAIYICENCGHYNDFRDRDFDGKFDYEIHSYLMETEELGGTAGGFYFPGCHGEYTVNVPVHVECSADDCEEEIEILLEVQATPEWEEDDPMSDRVPDVESFEFYVTGVLGPDETPTGTTTLGPPFEDYDFEHIELSEPYTGIASDEVLLRIICKTKMSRGFCYMGIDEHRGRILRPIFNTKEGLCCWPRGDSNFEVGSSILFRFFHHPDDANSKPRTAFPHAYEDLVVDERSYREQGDLWDIRLLKTIARQNIVDVFPASSLEQNRYVVEGAKCPSAGVICISESDISVQSEYGKLRATVRNNGRIYNFPVTADQFDAPNPNGKRSCLVMLGLGRPYSGTNGRRFNPARCYVLAIGIKLLTN